MKDVLYTIVILLVFKISFDTGVNMVMDDIESRSEDLITESNCITSQEIDILIFGEIQE